LGKMVLRGQSPLFSATFSARLKSCPVTNPVFETPARPRREPLLKRKRSPYRWSSKSLCGITFSIGECRHFKLFPVVSDIFNSTCVIAARLHWQRKNSLRREARFQPSHRASKIEGDLEILCPSQRRAVSPLPGGCVGSRAVASTTPFFLKCHKAPLRIKVSTYGLKPVAFGFRLFHQAVQSCQKCRRMIDGLLPLRCALKPSIKPARRFYLPL